MPVGYYILQMKGNQDYFLTKDPDITYFKYLHRKHTNFATETIDVHCNGYPEFGKRVTFVMPRRSDLIGSTYAQIILPEIRTKDHKFRWKDNIGELLLGRHELEIGNYRVNTQFGEFYKIWNELTMSASKLEGYNRMTGQQNPEIYVNKNGEITYKYDGLQTFKHHHPETKLLVPLKFYYCDNPGLYLPLICLGYNEVRINFNIENIDKLLEFDNKIDVNQILDNRFYLKDFTLKYEGIFLDLNERKKFVQNSHKYLITDIQLHREYVNNKHVIVLPNFRFCIKEFIWTIEEENKFGGDWIKNIYYNLATQTDKYLTDIIFSYLFNSNISYCDIIDNINKCKNKKIDKYEINNISSLENNYQLGECPLESLMISLNQQYLIAHSGFYYNNYQPDIYHSNIPKSKGIFVYSFSLKPEEIEHTGIMNASVINDIKFDFNFKNINQINPGILNIYARNNNFLMISNGMGAHQFD